METTTDTLKYPLSAERRGKLRAKIEHKQQRRMERRLATQTKRRHMERRGKIKEK